MIEREITPRLTALFRQYPFVTVTGPRQSGKTTLCQAAFPDLEYANLEAPDLRDFAESDPRGFLAQFDAGAILDEIQRVPELLSYLQVIADERGRNGLYVLTGSEQFPLSDAVNQSLAGRTGLLRLLPFSLAERQQASVGGTVDEILYSGFYPRIIDQHLNPTQALADYFETYVERDVRRLGEIRNLSNFRRFVRLCAGRVGQLVNLSSLGADAGVSHTTAREWLTILEASYILFQLPPYVANISKRLVKSPKIYFCDVGLAAYLVGIENAGQVATHPLRGALFENAVVAEVLKHRFNRGRQANLSFFRDSKGLECDLFYPVGDGIAAFEVKSGATLSSDHFRSLHRVAEWVPDMTSKIVAYGGPARQSRSDAEAVTLDDLPGTLKTIDVNIDIAAFVEENTGPAPDDADLRALDSVYMRDVRPMLDGLRPTLEPLANALFRDSSQTSYVCFDNGKVTGSLLEARHWESTKVHHIVSQGFQLSSSRPLEISHVYKLGNYTGKGNTGFSVELTIWWRLDGERVTRSVAIDGSPLPELAVTMPYGELCSGRWATDSTIAEIGGRLMRRVGELSGASPHKDV
ncbi:MAG: ATP-binding protein [Candidatus Tectomicrobia bacterium]|nr:ATP-binding protein [Candidatus Tectomicrobia bacterium]